jgi:hypothetical protein
MEYFIDPINTDLRANKYSGPYQNAMNMLYVSPRMVFFCLSRISYETVLISINVYMVY